MLSKSKILITSLKAANIIVLALLLGVFGCDPGLGPPSVLTGNVIFTGTMAPHIQYCYVVVAIDRPPGDSLDISYLANYYDIPLPLKSDTVPFRIELGEGTYNWVFVAAIGNTDSIGPWNIIGEYIDPVDSTPIPIKVGWADSLWIQISADLDKTYKIP